RDRQRRRCCAGRVSRPGQRHSRQLRAAPDARRDGHDAGTSTPPLDLPLEAAVVRSRRPRCAGARGRPLLLRSRRMIMEGRRLIEERWIRWDDARADAAYARGLWVRQTLGDALKLAAAEAPRRVAVIDGDVRLDCATWLEQAERLARQLLDHAAPGQVVSCM